MASHSRKVFLKRFLYKPSLFPETFLPIFLYKEQYDAISHAPSVQKQGSARLRTGHDNVCLYQEEERTSTLIGKSRQARQPSGLVAINLMDEGITEGPKRMASRA
jgi:hypothetical protein